MDFLMNSSGANSTDITCGCAGNCSGACKGACGGCTGCAGSK